MRLRSAVWGSDWPRQQAVAIKKPREAGRAAACAGCAQPLPSHLSRLESKGGMTGKEAACCLLLTGRILVFLLRHSLSRYCLGSWAGHLPGDRRRAPENRTCRGRSVSRRSARELLAATALTRTRP